MSTVDKIMALADEYMRVGDEDGMREALRAAIVEALDMGEPVAYMEPPYGWLQLVQRTHDEWAAMLPQLGKERIVLYAAKDKP